MDACPRLPEGNVQLGTQGGSNQGLRNTSQHAHVLLSSQMKWIRTNGYERNNIRRLQFRIDHNSRSTDPNATKFSQQLAYKVKDVPAKFHLDWINSLWIKNHFVSITDRVKTLWGGRMGPLTCQKKSPEIWARSPPPTPINRAPGPTKGGSFGSPTSRLCRIQFCTPLLVLYSNFKTIIRCSPL